MPSIVEAFDLLRGRFQRCRHGRNIEDIAQEIGSISHPTLKRFLRGEPINQRHALAIESWCDRQEEEAAHADDE